MQTGPEIKTIGNLTILYTRPTKDSLLSLRGPVYTAVLFAVFSTTPAAASHLTRFGLEAYRNRNNYCRDSSVTEPLRLDVEVDG